MRCLCCQLPLFLLLWKSWEHRGPMIYMTPQRRTHCQTECNITRECRKGKDGSFKNYNEVIQPPLLRTNQQWMPGALTKERQTVNTDCFRSCRYYDITTKLRNQHQIQPFQSGWKSLISFYQNTPILGEGNIIIPSFQMNHLRQTVANTDIAHFCPFWYAIFFFLL